MGEEVREIPSERALENDALRNCTDPTNTAQILTSQKKRKKEKKKKGRHNSD